MKRAILGTLTFALLVTVGVCLNAWSAPWHSGGGGSWHDGGCGFHRQVVGGGMGPVMMDHGMFGHGMGPMFMDRGMMGDDMHLVMMAEKLNLTSDQRDKIGKIMDAAHSQMRDLLFKMMDAHKEIRNLTHGAAKPDDAKLRELADQQGKLAADMMYLAWKSRADMRAVLTPDQLKRFDSFHKDRWHRKGSRMEHRPRRGMSGPGAGA